MSGAATIAAVIVGIAFLAAGASKIAAGPAWGSQARGLGAPALVVPFVPWIELVIGALLVAQVARSLAAVAAFVLLAVFTALIAYRLAQGERPPCACFGAWSAKPIGPSNIVRNLALMALAALALLG